MVREEAEELGTMDFVMFAGYKRRCPSLDYVVSSPRNLTISAWNVWHQVKTGFDLVMELE